MPNVTLAIPKELHTKMKKHSEIRWSEVVRKSISNKISDLEMMDKLTKRSKLTEKDALEIGRKINKAVAKKHGLLA